MESRETDELDRWDRQTEIKRDKMKRDKITNLRTKDAAKTKSLLDSSSTAYKTYSNNTVTTLHYLLLALLGFESAVWFGFLTNFGQTANCELHWCKKNLNSTKPCTELRFYTAPVQFQCSYAVQTGSTTNWCKSVWTGAELVLVISSGQSGFFGSRVGHPYRVRVRIAFLDPDSARLSRLAQFSLIILEINMY